MLLIPMRTIDARARNVNSFVKGTRKWVMKDSEFVLISES